MGVVIFLVVAAGIGFLLYKRSKAKKAANVPVFAAYYAEKRRQFPWLDKWLKENGDPSQARATEFMASKDPSETVRDDNYEQGLTLECPSCHCPHSWGMYRKELIVDKVEVKTNVNTMFLNDDLAVQKAFREKKVIEALYSGRSIKDFKCQNCGHTEHNEYDTEWKFEHMIGKADVRASLAKVYEYNPPMTAWGYKETATKQSDEAKKLYEEATNAETQTTAPTPTSQATQASNDNAGINPSLLKSAEMGNEDAKLEIGVKYLLGLGVPKDKGKAATWLDSNFQTDDGSFDFYELGSKAADRGIYALAIPLLEKAAETSNVFAFNLLGICYSDELGNVYNKEKARYWYQKAADMGDKDAKKALKELK